MPEFLNRLPTLLVMVVLLAIFATLERQRRAPWVTLWLRGWGLIFGHNLLQAFGAAGAQTGWLLALDRSLWWSGVAVFAISMSRLREMPQQRRTILSTLNLVGIVYCVALSFGVASVWLYLPAPLFFFFGCIVIGLRMARPVTAYDLSIAAALFGLGIFDLVQLFSGNYLGALHIMLATLLGCAGLFFMRRQHRFSPGTLTTVAGFWMWAGAFPLTSMQSALLGPLVATQVWWDVPRYLVAVGMIVTLLEDESGMAQAATRRERSLKSQMQSFAALTSKLLGGNDAIAICPEIARTIVAETHFAHAVILTADDSGRLSVAAAAEASGQASRLAGRVPQLSADEINELCAGAEAVGHSSYRASCGLPEHAGNDELVVPLRTAQGGTLGCIWLGASREGSPLQAEDLAPLEMLALHLGAALDHARLQRQLLVNEKLASLGQLVSGLTHELNNPLTAVLGYTELLLDRPADEPTRRDLNVIQREAGRMKRILQNLVRFAQPARGEQVQVSVQQLLSEVMSLREYEGRTRNVQITTDIPADLPRVPFDPELLRQVFFNLLNNSLDAVEKSLEKKVTIDARVSGERLVMQFCDSGPGFADLTRVFDPFYTTRDIGRGTGLGLSVCFGILKQHGGDIWAKNLEPRGGCVVLELPLTSRGVSMVGHATGKMGAIPEK